MRCTLLDKSKSLHGAGVSIYLQSEISVITQNGSLKVKTVSDHLAVA